MGWYRRFINVLRPERLSGDIRREMEFHMAERADDLMAAGMTEPDARREARRRFGNPSVQRERTRDTDMLTWLESLGADVRYALRALRASPAFAIVAIVSLGLGIGANTAIFSLINAVVLRTLPVERPEELMQVTMAWNPRNRDIAAMLIAAGAKVDARSAGGQTALDYAPVAMRNFIQHFMQDMEQDTTNNMPHTNKGE